MKGAVGPADGFEPAALLRRGAQLHRRVARQVIDVAALTPPGHAPRPRHLAMPTRSRHPGTPQTPAPRPPGHVPHPRHQGTLPPSGHAARHAPRPRHLAMPTRSRHPGTQQAPATLPPSGHARHAAATQARSRAPPPGNLQEVWTVSFFCVTMTP